jgi:RNA methyltransferase, TrmH family
MGPRRVALSVGERWWWQRQRRFCYFWKAVVVVLLFVARAAVVVPVSASFQFPTTCRSEMRYLCKSTTTATATTRSLFPRTALQLSLSRSSSSSRSGWSSRASQATLHESSSISCFIRVGRQRWQQQLPCTSRPRCAACFSVVNRDDAQSPPPPQQQRQQPNVITNPKSTTVKKIQALLSSRQARQTHQQVVLEGPRLIRDVHRHFASSSGERGILEQIIVDMDQYEHYQTELEIVPSETNSPRWTVATAPVLAACTDTVTNQGIVAIARIPQWNATTTVHTLRTHQSPPHTLVLVLDGVADPGNVGTLVRSAVASGVSSIVLLPGCCDVWNPKAIRSAMGATFGLPIFAATSFEAWYHEMMESPAHCNMYAATMLDENDTTDSSAMNLQSTPHYHVDWCAAAPNTDSSAASAFSAVSFLIIGSEGSGLSSAVRHAVGDGRVSAVHVPMSGRMESLNAAVCGSTIMFEAQRQRALQNRSASTSP